MRSLLRPLFATIAAAAVLMPGPATGAEEYDARLGTQAPATLVAPSAAIADAWGAAQIADDRELAQQRGGADLHVNENNASAIVRDNVATNLSTGNNSINGESFSGMSGVPMVVQNSGNNVVIQNSTILNLQLH